MMGLLPRNRPRIVLQASHADRDELVTSLRGKQVSDYFSAVDFFGDEPYFICDVPRDPSVVCDSSFIFGIEAAVARIASKPIASFYALLPVEMTGLNRRMLSPVKAVWVCEPPENVKPKRAFWRVETDLLTFFVDGREVALGDEISKTLVWSE